MRAFALMLVLSSCAIRSSEPRTLAEFEARSVELTSSHTPDTLTGLDPVEDWALLLWTIRAARDPQTYPYDVPLFVSGLEEMDVEQALVLATSNCGKLFLPDLTSLDPATAAALASGSQELFLDGLESISVGTARAIVSGGTRRLSLKGLKQLDPKTAVVLAELDGSLHLDGLSTMPEATVRALAGWRGWGEQVILHLGVVEPTIADLEALAGLEGWGLALDQVRQLSPERARALGSIVRPYLALNGLHTVTDEAAQVMATWRAKFLIMDGLTSLTPSQRAQIEEGCAALTTRSLPPTSAR